MFLFPLKNLACKGLMVLYVMTTEAPVIVVMLCETMLCLQMPWYQPAPDHRLSHCYHNYIIMQNGHHFPDNIFKCIFLNENLWITMKISLKFVRKVRINNIPALFQIMAWHCPGNKPLSEPMMANLLMHIYVTRPQWVKVNCSGAGPGIFQEIKVTRSSAVMILIMKGH